MLQDYNNWTQAQNGPTAPNPNSEEACLESPTRRTKNYLKRDIAHMAVHVARSFSYLFTLAGLTESTPDMPLEI